MKGKGYLFEIAAIGYLRNDAGSITETDVLYPITTILAKDFQSAKFELTRRLSDDAVEKYGSNNIDLIVRSMSSNGISLTSGTTTTITF